MNEAPTFLAVCLMIVSVCLSGISLITRHQLDDYQTRLEAVEAVIAEGGKGDD